MGLPDFFHSSNAQYIEQMYEQYLSHPGSVDSEWSAFFAGFDAGSAMPTQLQTGAADRDGLLAQGVYDLVHSYRELGHFEAQLDPLGSRRPGHPLLQLSEFGFTESDLDRQVGAGSFLGPTDGSLRGLIRQLRATYCQTLGAEYMGIADKEQRVWLQERMEPALNRPQFSADESRRILSLLVDAEGFEQFLHTKYVGQKRFSIEGADSLIPLLDTLIEHGTSLGAREFIMGMAHRGRLNVLANILHKPVEIILSEFEGKLIPEEGEGDGDVKYHLGYSHDRVAKAGAKVHISLCPNPSHLELVNPIVEGIVRAKQHYLGDRERTGVVPILIHGDAAFTGQGIVSETLSLSELPHYRTGGTIHIIINNQLGFTAPPEQTRFTPYPTDVARMIQAPIFHVNADDPEAVVHSARIAIAFRQRFKVDVMIDLQSYRRYGHNETDDPTFTQPLMYQAIGKHASARNLYAKRLMAEGKLDQAELDQMTGELRDRLESSLTFARELRPRQRLFTLGGVWTGMQRAGRNWGADTAVDRDMLVRVTDGAQRLPADFSPHPKLQKLFTARTEMARGERPIDWGCAEMWAIGSLLLEGTHVRLVGQDTERGTFSHRHAVLHDVKRGTCYIPLAHLDAQQAPFTVTNTMLSELAVLGFEYGFSWADPRNLVIWEAQFGDFINCAQPVVDLFISSAETKWQRMSGLVLLLPHGYEGQGPEHSSTRVERFLQLCAEQNIQVCCPTLPAQYFHLLRRQMRRDFRKPLALMTPKSLLRDERYGSAIEEFTAGHFRSVIPDPESPDRDDARRLIFCTGKIYFALAAARHQSGLRNVALVRLEQLYPFPKQEVQTELARYRRAHEVCWVQEEPRNMGAWTFIEPRLREILPDTCVLAYHGRDEAASPATGSYRLHQIEQEQLINEALDLAQQSKEASQRARGDGPARAR
jgi:2-oxoglutarate dehydrogenase E1 component